MGHIQVIRKPYRDYDRSATPNRILATRFTIYCYEKALEIGAFPRDQSLFKVDMEFRLSNFFEKNSGHVRASLAQRLSRIFGRIVYGRKAHQNELRIGVAVEEWTQRSEIKAMLAEKVLTGDA
jgi:hypothetical protein